MSKEQVVKEQGIETTDSVMTAAEFKKIMAAYKEQNPVKYAQKEKRMLEKLKGLEAAEKGGKKDDKDE